jgi:hypothetical protein
MAATLRKPGTIINLLKKAKGVYQKTPADPRAPAELRYKQVGEDLRKLRDFARKEGGGGDLSGPFGARKKLLLKKMKDHYQALKKERDRDPNKATLPRYLKVFGSMTLVVKGLEFATLEDGEDADATLDDVAEVDLSALDSTDDRALIGAGPMPEEDAAESPVAAEPAAVQAPKQGGRTAWQAARVGAVNQLRKIQTAILKTKDADSAVAIRLLEDIVKRLAPNLESRQSVIELERYLATDPVVARVEVPNDWQGCEQNLRGSLLPVLARLREELAA